MANNKFCIECRFELPITAKFCERCGFTFVLNQSTSESEPIIQTIKETTPETSESKDFLLKKIALTTKILSWLFYINILSICLQLIIPIIRMNHLHAVNMLLWNEHEELKKRLQGIDPRSSYEGRLYLSESEILDIYNSFNFLVSPGKYLN